MIPASVGFQCPECVREGQASVRAPRRTGGLQAAGRRWGAVTLTLIAANVAMFLVSAVSAASVGNSPLDNYDSPVFDQLSQWPYGVQLFGEWWRVFTAAFLHIGPLHLAMNMLALLIFGSELERQLGRVRFLALYLLSALGGAAAIQLFGDPRVPVAGASTAIYGLLGGLAVLMLVNRQDLRGLLTLLAINIFISFLPGVSLLGHLGGLVAGALTAGILVLTRRRPRAQLAGPGGVRRRPAGPGARRAHGRRAGHLAAGRVQRPQGPGDLLRVGSRGRAAPARPGPPGRRSPGRCPARGSGRGRRDAGSPGRARAGRTRAGAGRPVRVRTSTPSGPAASRGRARRSRAARTSTQHRARPHQNPAGGIEDDDGEGQAEHRRPPARPSRPRGGTTAPPQPASAAAGHTIESGWPVGRAGSQRRGASPMRDAVICAAVRTPVGKRGGGLSGVHAVDLSAHVLTALAERSGLDPARRRGRLLGLRQPGRRADLQHRPQRPAGGRLARVGARHDDRPAVRVVPAGGRVRGGDGRSAGRPTSSSPAAWSR